MPDSTHRRSFSGRWRPARAAAWLSAVLVAMLLVPAGAVADGDPASDVLLSQPAYVPADGGFSQGQSEQLQGLLTSAQRAGVPIRVALIATKADLGSVGELWAKPQSYAKFLALELGQVYKGTLVVAMPAGLGVSGVGGAPGPAASPGPTGRPGPLIPAAIRLVQSLAAAEGHRLTAPTGVAVAGQSWWLGSVDLGSWLALAAGAALIAVAWTASLRARPLARGRRAR
ncbi:MAG TPA: hypothetical protein VMF14_04385 [Solirubrobacteraceae bacterium]|nr:hypothetical protein [Solirubrobacteraceae bacterium]